MQDAIDKEESVFSAPLYVTNPRFEVELQEHHAEELTAAMHEIQSHFNRLHLSEATVKLLFPEYVKVLKRIGPMLNPELKNPRPHGARSTKAQKAHDDEAKKTWAWVTRTVRENAQARVDRLAAYREKRQPHLVPYTPRSSSNAYLAPPSR
jgi:hypothetical protein